MGYESKMGRDRRWAVCQAGTECVEPGGDDSDRSQGLRHGDEESRLNPESADATIARDSDIFIADTLSEQNCNQLAARGVEYLILKENTDCINDFKQILKRLDIPFEK